jgi:lipopolysaccharide transport system ATP-binding protein
MPAIKVTNLSKIYKLYANPVGRLKEALWRGRKRYHNDFWAIKDVSFEVEKGTTFGIIGRNGSGKSTLLQMIAGILEPSAGEIRCDGRISALLELGSGFDPEFTGRENVFMNGSILGIEHREIAKRFSLIEAFADIGKFIDQPVKLYSSGMYVRLAFATAINVDPDILIVDEALAVGDVIFQHRCMRKIRELQENGKTIVFVSHDTGAVQKLCSNVLLLENGNMVSIGQADRVLQDYYKIVWNAEDENPTGRAGADKQNRLAGHSAFEPVITCDHRFGNRKGEIIATALTDDKGEKIDMVRPEMMIHFSMLIKSNDYIDMPIAGIVMKDLLGNELIKTNTDAEGVQLAPCFAGAELVLEFSFKFPNVRSGSYAISAGIGNGTIDHHCAYDWIDNVRVVCLENSDQFYGLINVPVSVSSHVSAPAAV